MKNVTVTDDRGVPHFHKCTDWDTKNGGQLWVWTRNAGDPDAIYNAGHWASIVENSIEEGDA